MASRTSYFKMVVCWFKSDLIIDIETNSIIHTDLQADENAKNLLTQRALKSFIHYNNYYIK